MLGLSGREGIYGDSGEDWFTGDTIIAKEGDNVCIGRAGGMTGVVGGNARRFGDGGAPDTRRTSSTGGSSSVCFRFLVELEAGG